MEIHHKLKPPKNWREFLKEYGIIVLGVLTALGAEQAVEAVHHRAEIGEAREALREELAWNLTSFEQSVGLSRCILARLDELQRWEKSWEKARPLKLLKPISFPVDVVFRSSVWRITAGDAVSRMPMDERTNYARLYDGLEMTAQQRLITNNAWADLAMYENARRLSDVQLLPISKDIHALNAMTQITGSNYKLMKHDFDRLGIQPSSSRVFELNFAQQTELCKPLLRS